MLVTGEEKGLLGSEYYAEGSIPSGKHRRQCQCRHGGTVDKKHEGNPDYIYVIGSDQLSTDLHRINREANARTMKLELDYTYNARMVPTATISVRTTTILPSAAYQPFLLQWQS